MRINQYYTNETYLFLPYSEEDPALLLSPFVSLCDRIPGELALLVEYLGEVRKDSGGFENRCGVMSDSGDTSVRVDLEEPRRLDLVVHLANVGVADTQFHCTIEQELWFSMGLGTSIERLTRSLDRRMQPIVIPSQL